MKKEIELANEIIKSARNKKVKTNKEYEAIIDLSYLITIISENNRTEQANYIVERLRSGYYDEINKEIEVKKEELKLSDDNMQYCFFFMNILRRRDINMAKTSCRIFKIKCVGDSDNVANMLEDIAKKIRNGMIHTKEEMFYEVTSQGYVKEEDRGDWYEKDIAKVR